MAGFNSNDCGSETQHRCGTPHNQNPHYGESPYRSGNCRGQTPPPPPFLPGNQSSRKGSSSKAIIVASIIAAAIVLGAIIIAVFGGNSAEVAEDATEYGDSTVVKEEAAAAVPSETLEPTKEEIDRFARQFRRNMKFGEWEAVGEPDENNSGDCRITLRNNNPTAVDGSDFKVQFKYEYLYSDPPLMSETVTKKGRTLESGSSMEISHFYTDDCGPLEPKVIFTVSNEELYRKYHR